MMGTGVEPTGQLGVFKYSRAGLSYIRSKAKEFVLIRNFSNTDIHIHIPEGAIPKDGPSWVSP